MAYSKTTTHIVDDRFASNYPGGKYNLIIVAARRAHDLQKGMKPLIDDIEGHKYPTIALKEIEAGLITHNYPRDFIDPHKEEEEVEENVGQ
jgi:DNA-directed RNA polymerase omega subunit